MTARSKLSNREFQVLEGLLEAEPSVVAITLRINKHQIAVHKTNVRRKEARAKKFLFQLRKYKSVLHPAKKYRGL